MARLNLCAMFGSGRDLRQARRRRDIAKLDKPRKGAGADSFKERGVPLACCLLI